MTSVERAFPYLQIATALAPLGVALFLRVTAGANRFTGLLVSLATTWFAVNVLLAPFTDVSRLIAWFR
jgi:hypothetical protein